MATTPVSASEPTARPMGPKSTRRLLRVAGVAEYLGMSMWKVRQLILSAELPYIQSVEGGPFLVDIRDLDAWIERQKRTTLQ